ncbi:MAG: poly(R)-hydroxyalkanoic acid synthase, class III, PhaE subunit [Candidatus Kentron sp. G]|nr:MAG: poly(R)-hydroxyalkanoic acid synthase, class III, PhaE subunit [Candidatus Kentron sp. G]VFM98230.1 MAG: poly(R)-hydroxyalkanoic acid synthase, class III, PhaE subunit [Candidatus Kentron sp. G]VFN00420.1 MAG: poly(R)-hydroxyalkanoic acid synthase, class III, PhaE subunit [Candidatus Kentron sp. G]
MNWTEQVEPMMKMWIEAQKQFLGGWYGLASGVPGMPTMPNLSDPMSWFTSGLPAWIKNSTTGQGTAGNLFASQTMMMESLGMLGRAWQAITPSLSAGKPWQPDFDIFLKQWTQEISGAPQRFSTATTGMNELMKSFLGEWGPLLQPWLASIRGTGLGGPFADVLGEKPPFNKMFGMFTEPAFQDLAQIPMIGVGREQMAKITRAFDAYVDTNKAISSYQEAVTKTIGEAMKETIEQLVGLSKQGEQISSVRELIRLWVKIADRKFTQMYVSEDFLKIQQEMSRANLQNKLAQRAVLEIFLKQLDIPTRTELDDAYKTLYSLRKEVRELRNAHKQSGVEAAAADKARERAESELTKLHSTSRRLETDLGLLHDALESMEARLIANQPEETPKPAPAPSGKEPAPSNKAEGNSAARVAPAQPAKPPVKKPVKVTKKKAPPQKATA